MEEGRYPYYAVRVGRATGIFTSWKLAKSLADGHSFCEYKGFKRRSEAETYMNNRPDRSGQARRSGGRNTKTIGEELYASFGRLSVEGGVRRPGEGISSSDSQRNISDMVQMLTRTCGLLHMPPPALVRRDDVIIRLSDLMMLGHPPVHVHALEWDLGCKWGIGYNVCTMYNLW
ncbi:hypothetical protein PIB30_021142 [Stylosanthes scabra]|uniref:Ribonuclease H1 N-terminal domain-containing protein n=1 Tax=Stylosanthes scabra TaxID=79078 RepID=A0ABU6R922_9FABA|nr:hypothetical protein [Stylosanthes scabra]